jgi:citrate synthase
MSVRVNQFAALISSAPEQEYAIESNGVNADAKKESLTIVDNRSGKKYELPIKNNTIDATLLAKIRAAEGKPPLRSYDPGYMNTASATSRITRIAGSKGILRYRGYPIEQLAEKADFLEVAFCILYGQLPTKEQDTYFKSRVMNHTYVHEELKSMMKSFRYDAHPMGMLIR